MNGFFQNGEEPHYRLDPINLGYDELVPLNAFDY